MDVDEPTDVFGDVVALESVLTEAARLEGVAAGSLQVCIAVRGAGGYCLPLS
jgi:hypothetical protein